MNLRRVGAVVLRQLYLYRSSPQRVLPLFIWVALDIVLWGFITRFLGQVSRSSFNFVPALLGAVLLWDFLTRVMQGITTAFFEDVWSRNFLNVFATPMRTSEYLTGLVAIGVTNSFVALLVMFTLAWALFGLSFLAYGVALVPFLGVLFLTGIGLGVLGAAMVLRLGPASEWLIWPIPTLLAPFAGVFYRLNVLPGWMQIVAKALPPSYVFEGMRAVVSGKPAPWDQLAIGGGLALIYLALACAAFAAVYRFAIRTGLIARYSAETVS
ncbi:MAG TPA: ABC transporter permease [Caulobacteraceae bacterium]|nr:ABC transporter permease [Caulobacteraceae bacterium]